MPIYEYICEKCGEEMEAVQKITDPPLTTHAQCGGKLKKLISNSAFVLKGGGWYVTDYPSESRKKGMASEKGGASSGGDSAKNADNKSKASSDSGSTKSAPAVSSSVPAESGKIV